MKTLKTIMRILAQSSLAPILSALYCLQDWITFRFYAVKWYLQGYRKPGKDDAALVRDNVTFIYKSFERQRMAIRLYRNIQSYFPGVRVIIADDSEKPLQFIDKNLTVLQLPFNGGLGYGLKCALEQVQTPFVVRMDDDERIILPTRFEQQLRFLMEHPEIDLVAVLPFTTPGANPPEEEAKRYYSQPMSDAPKALRIPHMTQVDDRHIIVGKPANIFLARTEQLKKVGYDPNIRMIDHDDFFYRAAGVLVSAMDITACVFHSHNRFDRHYQSYRTDVQADRDYIARRRATGDTSIPDRQEMRPEDRFLDALKTSLEQRTVNWQEMRPQNWIWLFQMAEAHHVLPMVYEAVYKCSAVQSADPGTMAVAKQHLMRAVMIQMRKTVEFRQLLGGLQKAGVTPMVVKGIVCRSLYPNPDARVSSDEDVLIPKEQFALCHQAMLDFGMELSEPDMDIEKAYEVPYGKKGSPLYIELHKNLFPPDSEAYGDFNRFFETAWERRITIQVDGSDIPTMGHTDHLFYLICHAFKHFLHSGFGIRQVCDICLYANAYGSQIDWERVLENCREIRADLFAASMFAIGSKYLTFDPERACLPLSWKELAVDEAKMLADLLDAGVFGNGSMSRKHSSNITLSAVAAEKRGQKAGNGVLKSLFPSAKKLEGRYPYLKNKPYLLPIAWAQRIAKYSKETASADSGNNAAEAIQIGKDRVELLREYGIIR